MSEAKSLKKKEKMKTSVEIETINGTHIAHLDIEGDVVFTAVSEQYRIVIKQDGIKEIHENQQTHEQKQEFQKERLQIAEQTWKNAWMNSSLPYDIDGAYAWIKHDNCWMRQFTFGKQQGWFTVEFKPNTNIVSRFGINTLKEMEQHQND
jgi:hypothetical protein